MALIGEICLNVLRVTSLLVGLIAFEIIFFFAYVSLSIGVSTGAKAILLAAFGIHVNIVLETFLSWYILASCTGIHLHVYRKCLLPPVRHQIRLHRNILQGIPRVVYFVLYSVAIYGICYEYEAVHNYRPLHVRQPQLVEPKSNSMNKTGHSRRHTKRLLRVPVYTNEDFAPEAPNEKVHTAMFLMMMSYLVYSTSQILGFFLNKITHGIPMQPMLPQIYATMSMMFLQLIMTMFYSFPIIMTLVACHIFRVDGASTYMFTLCLAVSVAMAAAQLESESPFPTRGRIGPYFLFENQHRARINVIFMFLPAIAYFFFERYKSYPLNAGDVNFAHFTFWMMITLLHTVKSLYLTTWRPLRPLHLGPPRPPQPEVPLIDVPPLPEPLPPPVARSQPSTVQSPRIGGSRNDNMTAGTLASNNGNNETTTEPDQGAKVATETKELDIPETRSRPFPEIHKQHEVSQAKETMGEVSVDIGLDSHIQHKALENNNRQASVKEVEECFESVLVDSREEHVAAGSKTCAVPVGLRAVDAPDPVVEPRTTIEERSNDPETEPTPNSDATDLGIGKPIKLTK